MIYDIKNKLAMWLVSILISIILVVPLWVGFHTLKHAYQWYMEYVVWEIRTK